MAASSTLNAVIEANSLNLYDNNEMNRFRKSVVRNHQRNTNTKNERRTDRERAQPSGGLVLVRIESTQHDARMLAGELVLSLSHVQRNVACAFPKLEEERGDSVRDSEVVELLRLTFRESLKERRHFRSVSNRDLVRLQRVVLRAESAKVTSTWRKTNSVDFGDIFESFDFHLGHDFVEIEELSAVERVERLQCSRSVSHLGVIGMSGDSNDSSTGK